MQTKELVNAANVITSAEAASLIRKSAGKIFSAIVKKRSNGALRRFTGRLGVRKGVTGVGQSFNARDHNLITINEFVRSDNVIRNDKGQFSGSGNMGTQFRQIAIEGIQGLKIGGTYYRVTDSPWTE